MKITACVLAGLLFCGSAYADHRLIVGANGSTLTGTDGGAGGALGYLHEINPGALLGVGAEHQTIADASWSFGSLRGALTRGAPTNMRWSVSGEVNYGSGEIGDRRFDHRTANAGLSLIFPSGLTLQLEDQHIEVDRTRGNLPKAGLSYLWNNRWLAGAAYSKSVSGNLGTELYHGRLDYYSPGAAGLNLFIGGATGQAAPAVFNLQTGLVQPGQNLNALYVGLTKPFSRAAFTLVGDYLNLSGEPRDIERFTLTLNISIYLRVRGQPR